MTDDYEWAGPNANIAKVLDKYCYGASRPPFALMLDGAWGCGKTWFIKRFFEEKKKNRISDSELGMIYVSLYGIQDAEEITKAIYAAMHPILGGKIGELGKVVFKGLLKSTLKIDLHHLENGKADLSAVLGIPDNTGNKDRIFRNRILVFDDVERAKMPVSDILALVQPLVESHEDRVILVANEKDIAADNKIERDRYERTKEKTVYLTLSTQPDMTGGLTAYLSSNIGKNMKDFLLKNRDEIISFIEKTNTKNIRYIYFLIYFGKELYSLIEKIFSTKNKDLELFKTLCILLGTIIEKYTFNKSLEEFKEMSIIGPIHDYNKNSEDDNKISTRKEEEHNRLKEMPYFSIITLHRDLACLFYIFLETGILNEKEIENSLGNIFYEDKLPSWKKLLLYQHMEGIKKIGSSLIEEFIYDFKNEEFSNDGDVLHVCGLYIMLYRIGSETIKDENPISTLKEYIKKYFKNLVFHDELLEYSPSLYEENHAHGYMYMEHDTNEFITIKKFFLEEKEKFLEEKIKLYVDNITKNDSLINSIEKDPHKFHYLNNNPYLHKIDIITFTKNLERNSPAFQYAFLEKLRYRFQQARNESNPLSPEKEWFEKLIRHFKEEIRNTDNNPLYRNVLDNNIKILQGQNLG
ncbi:P-loop NTPase fold protein [Bombella apis]|uniref:P-loop NTPase fold protein n=1 Tax=Bombella apis TaxID=1785988 RepID=UPI0012B9AB0D|nr:P-loop NTPase fold protein [Bombella apis]MPV99679.1 hypothetical protein [Bombella apis]